MDLDFSDSLNHKFQRPDFVLKIKYIIALIPDSIQNHLIQMKWEEYLRCDQEDQSP